jgi:nucleoside 2-deoxyribosyltransferase
LTKGNSRRKTIELEPLGHQYAYANEPEEEREALKEAFFHVALFRNVYDYYLSKGAQMPELRYLQNRLTSQFKLNPSEHQEFFDIYSANILFLESKGVALIEKPGPQDQKSADGGTVITAAEPKKATKLKAFVAMPFQEKVPGREQGFFSEVFVQLIEPAALAAGFAVETARRAGSDVIHSTIVNELFDADLVIVDLTDHNPNVLFELGVRMAINKPIALIKARNTGPIFDVDNMRFVEYDPRLWPSTVKEDLPKLMEHIQGTWKSRDSSPSYMTILRARSQQQ